MIAFYLISLLAFAAYVAVLLCKYGVPASISEGYYLIPGKWGPMAFAGFALFTALPMLVFWLSITDGTITQFLAFLSCAPLLFVGAAGAFRSIDITRRVHFIAAAICGVCSQIWIACNTWMWIASIVLFAAAFVLSRKYKGVRADKDWGSAFMVEGSSLLFFAEMAAFMAIYIAILYDTLIG